MIGIRFIQATCFAVSARSSPLMQRLDYLPKFQGMRPSISLCMC